MEHEAGPLLVDAQSTKRKRAEILDERPTEPHEKKRKLRSAEPMFSISSDSSFTDNKFSLITCDRAEIVISCWSP